MQSAYPTGSPRRDPAVIASLPLFHKIAGQGVLVIGDPAETEPKARLVERAGGVVIADMQRAIDEGVRLAFVGYEDGEKAEAMAIRLRCAGMVVNVVDKPDLCDFTTPSILDRNPLLIAVGTGGASAGLAKHVRLRLERILPPGLGNLARRLFAARDSLRARYPDGADRRHALDKALAEGGMLDILKEDSAQKVSEWLTSPERSADDRVLHTLSLTSRDPDDLTLRQARWLGEADVIAMTGDIPEGILARARADAIRVIYDFGENADPATLETAKSTPDFPTGAMIVHVIGIA